MRLYTVHEMSGAAGPKAARGDDVEFVHEGFCWPAFFAGLLWLLYKRLWLASLLYLIVATLLAVAIMFMGLAAPGPLLCAVAFHFLLAGEANDIHRWTLSRRGYREIAVVGGRNLVEAERDFFRQWSGPVAPASPTATSATLSASATPGAVWPRRPAADHGDGHGVLGLFPKAGG